MNVTERRRYFGFIEGVLKSVSHQCCLHCSFYFLVLELYCLKKEATKIVVHSAKYPCIPPGSRQAQGEPEGCDS